MALKMMVVDDEPAVLQVLKELIESAGFVVSAIADSSDAAARVNREKFDGVFLDARMPGMDGFELARRVRVSRANSRVPIVMLTGADDAETMRRGFAEGVSFFLGKPVTLKKLHGLLNSLRGAALRERRRYARLPLRTSVRCESGQKNFISSSLNISLGGMLLEFSGGLTPPVGVILEFSLPQTSRKLRPQARVVRREPPDRMAVAFTIKDSQDTDEIHNYISAQVKE